MKKKFLFQEGDKVVRIQEFDANELKSVLDDYIQSGYEADNGLMNAPRTKSSLAAIKHFLKYGGKEFFLNPVGRGNYIRVAVA